MKSKHICANATYKLLHHGFSNLFKINLCKQLLLQAFRKYVEVLLTAQTVEFQAAPKRGRPA
jgi:hypothetical protein